MTKSNLEKVILKNTMFECIHILDTCWKYFYPRQLGHKSRTILKASYNVCPSFLKAPHSNYHISLVWAQAINQKEINKLLLDFYCFPDDTQIMLLFIFRTAAAACSESLFTIITPFRAHSDPDPIIGYAQTRWAISEISSIRGCLQNHGSRYLFF